MTPARRAAMPLGAFLVLALAACAGGTDASQDSSTSQAAGDSHAAGMSHEPAASEAAASEAASAADGLCALVPIDQVETALGMTSDGGIGDGSFLTGGFSCRFTGDDEHILDVTTSEQNRDEWFEMIETVGLTDEEVTTVGEEAYRAAETALGGPGARFTAWDAGNEVGVTIYSDEPQDVTFAAAEAIALAVLASAGE